MFHRKHTVTFLMMFATSFNVARAADDPPINVNDRIRALEETVANQAKLIDQLQSKNALGENWLNEKRAAEVRALIHEVLADADTRASLLADGMAAGYNERGFFVGSPDGQYVLNLGALIQTRYIYNNRNNDFEDENVSGFDARRAEIYAGGVAYDFGYNVRLAYDPEGGDAYIKTAFLSRKLNDSLSFDLGGFRDNFTFEEQIEDYNQLTVERSLANEVFTNDYVLGLRLNYSPLDNLTLSGGLNNGSRSFGRGESRDFDDDSDLSVTGRVDYRILGTPDAWADFSSWSGEAARLRVGGGATYQVAETGDAGDNDKLFKWTADIGYESNGLGLFAAAYGAHTDDEVGDDQDAYGLVLQGSYFVKPDTIELFARYEYLDLDGGASGTLDEDNINILTVGMNYYCYRHFAKFTADVVYAMDPIPSEFEMGFPAGELGFFGLQPDAADEDGQFALRLQMQLNF